MLEGIIKEQKTTKNNDHITTGSVVAWAKSGPSLDHTTTALYILWGIHQPRQYPAYYKAYMECSKIGHFQKVCHSRRNRVINEKEYTEDSLEMVSINSVCLNKN